MKQSSEAGGLSLLVFEPIDLKQLTLVVIRRREGPACRSLISRNGTGCTCDQDVHDMVNIRLAF